MAWVMVHKGDRRDAIKWYDTEKGAKIGAAAANRNAGQRVYQIMHEDDFHQRKATVKSLMTGQDVEIPLRDVGTCVDPSTERYWSQ
jgi:hypothetical protein